MELAHHYLMMASMKRSRQSSWEEKAFAKDNLGGIVWPPRSYSCSFCHREFRSAQALGGHMNVHRRDRARLKQSSSLVPVPNPSLFRVSAPQHHHYKEDYHLENNEGGVLSSSYSTEKERSRLVLDDGIMGLKRVKVASISSTMFPVVKKCLSVEAVVLEKEEEEELDLELRLGTAAKLI